MFLNIEGSRLTSYIQITLLYTDSVYTSKTLYNKQWCTHARTHTRTHTPTHRDTYPTVFIKLILSFLCYSSCMTATEQSLTYSGASQTRCNYRALCQTTFEVTSKHKTMIIDKIQTNKTLQLKHENDICLLAMQYVHYTTCVLLWCT